MNNATEEKHILGIRGLNIEDCNKYADVINAKMRTIYDRITIFHINTGTVACQEPEQLQV
jgi:hypothetical protein